VDCQKYNVIPDRLQKPPTNPPDTLNYGHVPTRIVLKNGSAFTGVDVAGPAFAQISPAQSGRLRRIHPATARTRR
jgi:hypothetical protein